MRDVLTFYEIFPGCQASQLEPLLLIEVTKEFYLLKGNFNFFHVSLAIFQAWILLKEMTFEILHAKNMMTLM